jgi:glyceraldehyde-3-phosphate dehydrogenase/erythrose-4-phosphate dehydrogenase
MKTTKQMSEHARAARAIRSELKRRFQKCSFSVTSKSFSMGNAVYISWTNGPSQEEVNALVDKYQYGHFDGVTDCYEFSNKRTDIPQTKFVSTTRYESRRSDEKN